MRLWSISPSYLDTKGLVALWREALLGQSCLLKGEYTQCSKCLGLGKYDEFENKKEWQRYIDCNVCKRTGKIKTPYYNHPQLLRFKDTYNQNAINIYLYYIWYEANKRGYKFNHNKIPQIDVIEQIKDLDHNKLTVTTGQLAFEFEHLQQKLLKRCWNKVHDNECMFEGIEKYGNIKANPLFKIIEGSVESWEKKNENNKSK